MIRFLYAVISRLSFPIAYVYLLYRGIRESAYRDRRSERFGFVPEQIPQGCIWFHTVSAGEAIAAIPIIESVLSQNPDDPVLVTTTTPTGAQAISSNLGRKVWHTYVPYDIPSAVNRFLTRVSPRILFILETELWPNLIRASHRNGIPVYLLNARLSNKSALGYARVRDLTYATLNAIRGFACQFEDTAKRFRELGVPVEKIHVTGNVKFDVDLPRESSSQHLHDLKEYCQQYDRIWIAGSTHEPEEEIVLSAHQMLKEQMPDLLLILAPRHTHRCAEISSISEKKGLITRTTSELSGSADVLIVDQMGVLLHVYGFAQVAFIGGSLDSTGGHNPIEAALHGVPLLMGPNRRNFEEICRRFSDVGCMFTVQNMHDLVDTVKRLLIDAEERSTCAHLTRKVIEENRGALDRVQSLVAQWLRSC